MTQEIERRRRNSLAAFHHYASHQPADRKLRVHFADAAAGESSRLPAVDEVGAEAARAGELRLMQRFGVYERADREEVDQREAPMRADRSLQTDPLHVNAYWALPLHEVRTVALRREVPNAATSTRVQLAGELIRMDFATVH